MPNYLFLIKRLQLIHMNHLESHAILNKKKKNRQRKRLYRKARLTGKEQHWSRFRSLRNEVSTLIRESKTNHVTKIAASLKSGYLTSRNW